ncbi:DUF433 domain-containing protein [Massilia sp.]|uniref:DUF433 domain-containing protein n=1 Tax=Massilia sp. TaxID=1882437 RepID=UPI002899FD67|nr:DUF433 domain-containing protein [Massilia sp.]
MTDFTFEQQAFTFTEAAYALGESVKAVTRLAEEHPDLVSKVVISSRGRRVLKTKDLIYMQAARELRDVLTPVGRRRLHEALLLPGAHGEVSFEGLKLPLAPIEEKVRQRIDVLDRLKESVEGDLEDPLIKGTSIAVYRIAALLAGGATAGDVIADYPSLTPQQIELARDYALALPKKGRPYVATSFKRATRELDLQLIDELLAQEEKDEE